MNKVKTLSFNIAKSLVIMLSIVAIILVVFALGKPQKLTTQIGTIFGPILLPKFLLLLAVLMIVEIIILLIKGKENYLKSKLSIIALAFTAVAFISTSILWNSMCSVVRENGGSITVFDGFSEFKDPSDD